MRAEPAKQPPLVLPQRRQHTVSRVVLRQFARHKLISVFDRQANLIYSKGPNGVFHDYIDRHDPWGAERRWGEVENRMPEVYRLVHQRTALDNPLAIETLRDLMAIHWVRTPALRRARERIRERVKNDSIRKLTHRPDLLEHGMRQVVGLVPASAADLDWFNVRLHDTVIEATAEVMHSDSLVKNYQTAREILGRWHVQIAYSDRSDFLIGDTPVLTLKPNHAGVGPHQGVALGEANEIMMPIAPRVLIALGPEAALATVDRDFVERCNSLQLRGFTRWVGCQPGGLTDVAMRRHSGVRVL